LPLTQGLNYRSACDTGTVFAVAVTQLAQFLEFFLLPGIAATHFRCGGCDLQCYFVANVLQCVPVKEI